MKQELTDKTWGLQTRSFGTIWLTEVEAANAKELFKTGAEYLEIGELLITKGDIAGFGTGEVLRNVERKRRGEWQCKYEVWHQKGEQCGHDGSHW